jgi:hypothetical protein
MMILKSIQTFLATTFVALAHLLLFPSILNAQPAAVQTNGCGPIGFGALVPDSTLISGCEFTNACNAHDICYGRCLVGGDLHGQPTCNDKDEKAARKATCDKSMRQQIREDNSNRRICSAYAAVYYFAVSRFGDGNFQGLESLDDGDVKTLQEFLLYVESNPESFELDKVTAEIENLLKDEETQFINITFEKPTPALLIAKFDNAGKMTVVELEGKQ